MYNKSVLKTTFDDCNFDKTIFIDVRSPIEFEEFHIPNSISMPIFTNEERAEIGTTYKQIGQEEAIEKGIDIVSPKLSDIYKQVKGLVEGHPDFTIVITCARGGMRSGTIVGTLNMFGLPVYQLVGGMKSIRMTVTEYLNEEELKMKSYYVVEGHTGTNKTKILLQLQKQGYPVIDLEGLAEHRGSIFGHVGKKPNSQKQFELLLYFRLKELASSPYYIIEGESKRIGNVVLPKCVLNGKDSGYRVGISTSVENRVVNILADYQYATNREALGEAYHILKKRIPREIIVHLDEAWESGDVHNFIRILLDEYYDPRYSFKSETYDNDKVDFYFDNEVDVIEWLKGSIENFKAKIEEKIKFC